MDEFFASVQEDRKIYCSGLEVEYLIFSYRFQHLQNYFTLIICWAQDLFQMVLL
jgi:hypothetical protein